MWYIVIVLMLLLGGGGFGGWTYMQKLEAENQVLEVQSKVLKDNQSALETAVADQQAVIQEKQRQAEAIQAANNDLRVESARLESEKDNLAKKLGRHELDVLAANKPGLVSRVINKASPLTPKEKEASKPSQYNAECPTIHPNYNKPTENS